MKNEADVTLINRFYIEACLLKDFKVLKERVEGYSYGKFKEYYLKVIENIEYFNSKYVVLKG